MRRIVELLKSTRVSLALWRRRRFSAPPHREGVPLYGLQPAQRASSDAEKLSLALARLRLH